MPFNCIDSARVCFYPDFVARVQLNCEGGTAGVVAMTAGDDGFVKGHPVKPGSVDHDINDGVDGLYNSQVDFGGKQVQSSVWRRVCPQRWVVVVSVVEDDAIKRERPGCRVSVGRGGQLC